MPAPIGINEKARLEELDAYRVLDTPAEKAYDDITYLASQICEAPIALVSLVDKERQWFKSRVGLDATETSRDLAFCAHAINEPTELFVVGDASNDVRFAMNPLVTSDPNIRFYAGAPLTTASGNAMGTLCVIDRVPRQLDEQQTASLQALARMVVAHMELRRARDRAEAADHDKLLFLANMSHEIRTPLNAILGLSEVISVEMLGPIGDDRYREYASDINESGEHLLALVDDILDLSRIEANELTLDESIVRLDQPIEAAIRMLTLRAEDKGVRLHHDIPATLPKVRIDERRLRQVIINLVTNAIKFTPEGGGVSITAASSADGGIELKVSDDGIGMSAADIEKALTPFGQVSNHASAELGNGLGLPITKRLVEAHQGVFELRSSPSKGTTVAITLPQQRIVSRNAA